MKTSLNEIYTSLNEIYTYIAVAIGFILVLDTLLDVHPYGNIAGILVLLAACYRIGRSTK
jgi:hypothetical protein